MRFTRPVFAIQAPGDNSRWYVVENGGRIVTFLQGANASTEALDISARVDPSLEGGLFGLALAPDFASSGHAYISYTDLSASAGFQSRSVISRIRSTDGGRTFSSTSEQVLLTINQPRDFHNGGGIAFGPDGNLYVGFGDGGVEEASQDNSNLLGTFIRIDVSGGGTSYAIPGSNPFAGNPTCSQGVSGNGECPEIFAWGFRNPWRWSFDSLTGSLWAADVGSNIREEVNIVELGGNYGWPIREGSECRVAGSNCSSAGFIDPVFDYPHTDGNRAITGGYVYRGTALPSLHGRYIFADYVSGRIWALVPNADGVYESALVAESIFVVPSFAEAADRELYVAAFSGSTAADPIYQLRPDGSESSDTVPTLLSATGCVDEEDSTLPAVGLVPYRPGAPFWSDGAVKERWMALPDGAEVSLQSDGGFEFPAGSVLVKNFRRQQQLIETRLFMRHPDGVWAGYTYRWNQAQTDAQRVVGGATLPAGGSDWIYPSEAQCLQCHTASAGRTLGLEIAQLNNAVTYTETGRTANQLTTLEAIDMFAQPLPGEPETLPSLPDPFGSAPLSERARAYLHTNCANCHRPDGPTPSSMDWRFDTPLANTDSCDMPASSGSSLGIADARLLAPGDPGRSLIWARMGRRDVHAMPPVGSLDIDTAGLSLIQSWISELNDCG
ncbi:MAG: PQQ-dependent sugar dehydrogenase [Gammaproteobacteria bacterium]|nr:PQQ-dependent sugar dehydrogenase [Gammaproteobacteria bacterium]